MDHSSSGITVQQLVARLSHPALVLLLDDSRPGAGWALFDRLFTAAHYRFNSLRAASSLVAPSRLTASSSEFPVSCFAFPVRPTSDAAPAVAQARLPFRPSSLAAVLALDTLLEPIVLRHFAPAPIHCAGGVRHLDPLRDAERFVAALPPHGVLAVSTPLTGDIPAASGMTFIVGEHYLRAEEIRDREQEAELVLDSFSLPLTEQALDRLRATLRRLVARQPTLSYFSSRREARRQTVRLADGFRCSDCQQHFPPLTPAQFAPEVGENRCASCDGTQHEGACEECFGTRIAAPWSSYQFNGRSLAELPRCSVRETLAWLAPLDDEEAREAQRILECAQRLGFAEHLLQADVGHFSPGELLRVHLARILSGSLVDVTLFHRDELEILTVDELRELLPLLSEFATHASVIIAAGAGSRVARALQDQPLAAQVAVVSDDGWTLGGNVPRTTPSVPVQHLDGATTLEADYRFPAASLVQLVGRSGSGKSTFLRAQIAARNRRRRKEKGLVALLQAPVDPPAWGCLATELGVYEALVSLLCAGPDARAAGLVPRDFSLTSSALRCAQCRAAGVLSIYEGGEGKALTPLEYERCPRCEGARFAGRLALATYEAHSLFSFLEMPIARARELLMREAGIAPVLEIAIALGLGEVPFGQPLVCCTAAQRSAATFAAHLPRFLAGREGVLGIDDATRAMLPDQLKVLAALVPELLEKQHCVVYTGAGLEALLAPDQVLLFDREPYETPIAQRTGALRLGKPVVRVLEAIQRK